MTRPSRDWLLVGATSLVAATVLLPWAGSGSVNRSGWELATTAARLEVATGTAGRVMLACFFFIPAGAALTFLATAAQRRRLATTSAAITTVVAASGAVAVATSPLEAMWGLHLNLVFAGADLLIMVVPQMVKR